ncbi:MAG: LacI family DNA-binding transcriptional regulator [Pseudaminobacter sp.]
MTVIDRRRRSRGKFGVGVSLGEVALRANVSTASVSRVLNKSANVSEEVRQRVELACQELGYVPNGVARALAANKTMTIGAIVPAIENAGIAAAVAAFQRTLKHAGYTMLLTSSNYDEEAEFQEARTLLSRGVDGLMLVGGDHHPDLISLITHHQVPYIETWTLTAGRPCVGLDNVGAARTLTDYLVSLGHERIALIMGRIAGNDRAGLRVRGVRECLAHHGLPPPEEYLIGRPYNIPDIREAMQSLLAKSARPTALICGNDQIAFGSMIEASKQGLDVPADISIAGFNDLEFAAHLNPPLTTIRVPTEGIGRISAELLLKSVEDKSFIPDAVEIPATLVTRGSTAAPPICIPCI